MAESLAGTMKLVGGDPCLDFVNTVGGRMKGAGSGEAGVRDDKLGGYSDLLAWARHTALLSEGEARRLARAAGRRPAEAAGVWKRALGLREALYRVLRALMDRRYPEEADLEVLNAELGSARARERLVLVPGGIRWTAVGSGEPLDSVLAPLCRAAAALLVSGDLSRLRRCAGSDCGWLFLDRSRNRSRHWCSMADCGNVSKVRRHRRRRRGAARAAVRPLRSTVR